MSKYSAFRLFRRASYRWRDRLKLTRAYKKFCSIEYIFKVQLAHWNSSHLPTNSLHSGQATQRIARQRAIRRLGLSREKRVPDLKVAMRRLRDRRHSSHPVRNPSKSYSRREYNRHQGRRPAICRCASRPHRLATHTRQDHFRLQLPWWMIHSERSRASLMTMSGRYSTKTVVVAVVDESQTGTIRRQKLEVVTRRCARG